MGPSVRGRYRLAGAPLADPVPHLLGMKAHQAHQRFIAAQPGRQRMHTLNPQQGLQPIAPEGLHDRHHLALNRRALDPVHPVGHPKGLQEVEEVIQQRPFVQPVHPINDRLAVQPAEREHLGDAPLLDDLAVAVEPPARRRSVRPIKAASSQLTTIRTLPKLGMRTLSVKHQ